VIEEVLADLYRIEIPLPNSPLRALNSYFIRGPVRSLLVDTGMNREECRTAMNEALQELHVNMGETDIFLTHMHSDHSGLVSSLIADSTRVYCSRPDGERLQAESRWGEMLAYARQNGFPQQELDLVMDKHPGKKFGDGGLTTFEPVKEGDTLSVGDYRFRCVETPGHTIGHICLYDAGRRLLIAGDHVLGTITPNISAWATGENPLHRYLESLDRVGAMQIDLALPGHRAIVTDCHGRIQELKQHHQVRAEEILTILKQGPMTAYQVASRMTWNMRYDCWEQFPVPQKWFAAGEALSHLIYLEGTARVRRERVDGTVTFSRP
jgi:glyoxylase-like metal-dependent hydrolase (beta-lactamase superfamily II)